MSNMAKMHKHISMKPKIVPAAAPMAAAEAVSFTVSSPNVVSVVFNIYSFRYLTIY